MSDSPRTPRTQDHGAAGPARRRGGVSQQEQVRRSLGRTRESLDANGVTPMKRVPLLANFEEWMKMATDNKIKRHQFVEFCAY